MVKEQTRAAIRTDRVVAAVQLENARLSLRFDACARRRGSTDVAARRGPRCLRVGRHRRGGRRLYGRGRAAATAVQRGRRGGRRRQWSGLGLLAWTVSVRLRRHSRPLVACVPQWVAWWRNGRASDFRPRGHGFDPWSGRSGVTTLGKLFTPTCLDAESLRYYMESLNWVSYLFCVPQWQPLRVTTADIGLTCTVDGPEDCRTVSQSNPVTLPHR